MSNEVDKTIASDTDFDSEVERSNVFQYNRFAWNEQVEKQNRWTIPVTSEQVDRARRGDWSVVLTPVKAVPESWFESSDGNLEGSNILCLAGAGGQQAPLLAAAGASVTVLDASPKQLQQDEMVATRDRLEIKTIEGDMSDLSVLEDAMFDLIVHPCSNCFVPDLQPVWNESFRVLKPGGSLLSGFCNPVSFIFDDHLAQEGVLKVAHELPFSDLESIPAELREEYIAQSEPLCFGHTLEQQIGGQIRAGFAITGFFEDRWDEETGDPVSKYTATFAATKATKP